MFNDLQDEVNVIDLILEFKNDKTIETFKCLKVYFKNLTIEQIKDLNHNIEYEELINMVESNHKIIMSVFINQYLIPYFNKVKVTVTNKREMFFYNGILDIVNCIENINGYVSNNELIICKPKIKSLVKHHQTDLVRLINFGHNHILAVGLEIIVDIVQDLDVDLNENCILKLNNNRIHGVGSFREITCSLIKKLIENPKIKYLDLTNNEFCSIDQIDFFQSLTQKELEKLIFMNEHNIQNHPVLISKNIDTSRKTHVEYYKIIKNL